MKALSRLESLARVLHSDGESAFDEDGPPARALQVWTAIERALYEQARDPMIAPTLTLLGKAVVELQQIVRIEGRDYLVEYLDRYLVALRNGQRKFLCNALNIQDREETWSSIVRAHNGVAREMRAWLGVPPSQAGEGPARRAAPTRSGFWSAVTGRWSKDG